MEEVTVDLAEELLRQQDVVERNKDPSTKQPQIGVHLNMSKDATAPQQSLQERRQVAFRPCCQAFRNDLA